MVAIFVNFVSLLLHKGKSMKKVVARLIAAHVEENAIKIMCFEQLLHNPLQIPAVDESIAAEGSVDLDCLNLRTCREQLLMAGLEGALDAQDGIDPHPPT